MLRSPPAHLCIVGLTPMCCLRCHCLPQVDKDTMDMLRGMNMAGLPGVSVQQVRSAPHCWVLERRWRAGATAADGSELERKQLQQQHL